MGIVLENALLVDIDPLRAEDGALRLAGGVIAARGGSVAREAGDEVVDCGGAVVMPGMVNGHTHLYSALAAGMPMPAAMPRNFYEVLRWIWWRLDRALDDDGNTCSALAGAVSALKCGTTTLIDHHASPNAIAGSLDRIEEGIAAAGLRGVLCYEVTDRNGMAGRDAGLEENRRYLRKCAELRNGRFAGLVGAHASFTCGDETMAALAALARETGAGVHIHVAEDRSDEFFCVRDHDMPLIDRLEKFGMLNAESIFGHGVHLDAAARRRVEAAGVSLAHNTRSNMNNAVGYTPVGDYACAIQLGTDGIGGDMFAEAQTAWFKACDGGAGIAPARVVEMLAASARRASRALGVTLGKLKPGAAADIIITDYNPPTPLRGETFPAHLIFSMGSRNVQDVLIGGEWALRGGRATRLDEAETAARTREAAGKMWAVLETL